MRPRMIVVAGPPGSGKSTAFPVAASEVDYLNVDDLAARMNHGSYRNIPSEIRAEANRRCEAFIEEHIREKKSFAVEATLKSSEHTHSGFVALKVKDAIVDRLR